MTNINLRSRRGADGPLGFLVALPVWWATIGALLVLGYWFWSLAANVMGSTRGMQALLAGRDPEVARREVLSVALGGYASDFADVAATERGRAVTRDVNTTVDVHAFPSPDQVTVQVRTLTRIERFYPRPPEAGWE